MNGKRTFSQAFPQQTISALKRLKKNPKGFTTQDLLPGAYSETSHSVEIELENQKYHLLVVGLNNNKKMPRDVGAIIIDYYQDLVFLHAVQYENQFSKHFTVTIQLLIFSSNNRCSVCRGQDISWITGYSVKGFCTCLIRPFWITHGYVPKPIRR